MITVDVINSEITLADLNRSAPASGHGAGCMFVGYVRDLNMGKKVIAVEYDCFIPLTKKTFQDLSLEVQNQWGRDAHVLILHRQGKLKVGEISVLIQVNTRHRDESFRACRYVIEEVKKRAPIWKKEFYESSETEWVQGHALCQHHHASEDEYNDLKKGTHQHEHHSDVSSV